AVDLAYRAGRERLRIDPGEDVLPRDAELLLHHLDDLGLAERRDLVLEGRELGDGFGREQVGPGGEDLAELREGRAELLEGVPEAAGPLLRRVGVPARLAEAVLAEDFGDPRGPPEEPFVRGGAHSAPCVCTITTVQGTLWEMRFGTLPSRNSLRPLIPTLPT